MEFFVRILSPGQEGLAMGKRRLTETAETTGKRARIEVNRP
jgi:hypothetical protein